MRFHLPPKALRHEAVALLRDFYCEGDADDFARAWILLCSFYQIPAPRIRWRQRIDRGRALGLTHTDNLVELIAPGWWAKQPPPENDEQSWVATALHELFHVVHFVDEEEKADRFAAALMDGL